MVGRRIRFIEVVIFTVLVYTATIVLQIYQPTTGGYFNVGESMIYTAAMISSPLVAGIAGGVGAALADLSTGYAIFAPGTLIIKFIEGYVAGLLVKKFKGMQKSWQSLVTSGFYTLAFVVISSVLWAGGIYIGPWEWLGLVFEPPYVEVSIVIWVVIAMLAGGLMLLVLMKKHVTSGEVLALASAGILMVLGYFLYEFFISNPLTGREPIAAIAEIPVNIGQIIAGIAISVPITAWLRKAGYAR